MDTLVFKYGFEIQGMKYGWHKKKLYRLPSKINLRCYSFKEVPEILIGNKTGYRLMKKKYTIEQLETITCPILEVRIDKLNNIDCPF